MSTEDNKINMMYEYEVYSRFCASAPHVVGRICEGTIQAKRDLFFPIQHRNVMKIFSSKFIIWAYENHGKVISKSYRMQFNRIQKRDITLNGCC